MSSTILHVAKIRRSLAAFDFVASGSLVRRSLACGKSNCRCKAEPPHLHGPYYYWSRLHKGKITQTVLSPARAKVIKSAIRNYRMIRRMLKKWEEETIRYLEQVR